jgi:hypothetical protein
MRRALLFAACTGLACSTLARPQPSTGCETDDDCDADEVCSLDQGGICLPRDAPPRAYLAFEITDQNVTAEVRGCDEDLISLDENKLRLEVDRDDIVQTVALEIDDSVTDEGCTAFSGCAPDDGFQCLVGEDLCVAPLTSTVTIRQESRLGLGVRTSSKGYPVLDEEDMPLDEPVVFEWAYAGSQDSSPIVLDIVPDAAADPLSRARHRRALGLDASSQMHEVLERGKFPCNRSVVGTVRRYQGGPILAANVSLAYAEPVATPSTQIGGKAMSCDGDDDCPNGMACNPDHETCGVDLTGQRAGEAVSSDAGGFSAWVYSYCEDDAVAVDGRAFILDAEPPEISGLPRVRAAIEPEFGLTLNVEGFPPLDVPPADLDGDVCIPDWPSPVGTGFDIGAKPVVLVTTENGVDWRCCDTSCLPAGALLGDESPPAPETCTTSGTIRIATDVAAPDAQEWEADGCLPLDEDEDGNVGEYVRFVSQDDDCADLMCMVDLPPDADGEDPREYTVEIVQPANSVFRSQTLSVEIDPDTSRLSKEVAFRPRTLLRGEIVCAEDTESCNPTEAVILAERLRMPDEDPLGPYFYWQVAYATSETDEGEPRGARFSLPVNPGVYVVTALPAAGGGGGPARYSVIDLRNEAPGVTEGAVPKLDLEDPIELEAGLAVRLQLENFGRSTAVRPLDTGSWKSQDGLTLPGSSDPLDLNDPETCYNNEMGRGCQIRSLTRPDALLSPLQSGVVQFTTRNVSGGKGCPQN